MVFNLVKTLSIVFAGPQDTSTAEGRAKERTRKIALTALAAAVSKVFATIIPFITIRLTLNYLGYEIYGLWNAVTSFFALFAFADLGLGNGLQTILSRAYGQEDIIKQKKVILNSYLILTAVSLALIIIFASIFPFLNWAKLMNATNSTSEALVGGVVLAIVIPKLLSIPLSLIQRVQLAYQEGYDSHWWQCVASVFSLIFIYFTCKYNLGQLYLIWGSSLIPVFIFILNSLVYYNRKDRKISLRWFYVDKSIIRVLLKTGFAFFFLSILTTLGLSIDTFLVAKLGTLEDATPFSILHKIAIFITIICGMICTPLWSANGEAMARGEFDWVRKNTIRISIISLVFSIISSIAILSLSNFIFKIWLGPEFKFSHFCLTGMLITQIILAGISPFFMVLNAANIIKKQIYIFSFFTIASLIIKILLAPHFGVNIIPWITDISYIFCIVPFVIRWSIHVVKHKTE